MNCPYCAEEIKDEATFCRHCNHDFGLIKPLLAKVIKLEKQVEALINAPPVQALEAAPFYEFFASAVAVVLSVAWTSGYFLVMAYARKPSQNLYSYMLVISLPPIFFGLLNGLVSGRRSAKDYSLAGLSLGALNLLLVWSMLYHPKAHFQWALAILTFLIGQSFTFASMALLGNSIRNRSSARKKTDGGGTVDLKEISANLTLLTDIGKSIIALGTMVSGAYGLLVKVLHLN